MPQVRKQQYTRPIPAGAVPATMKIKRRGKSLEVPAVKFRGADGRMTTAPVVQSGKGAGTHYRASSECYYGIIKGKAVRLSEDKGASEVVLADLIKQAALGKAGMIDPHQGHRKRPLAEHVDDFAQALFAKGAGAGHVELTSTRIRKALIEGCGFLRLSDLDVGKVAGWLSARRESTAGPVEIPADRALFTTRDIADLLGIRCDSVADLLKALGVAAGRRGRHIRVDKATVAALIEKRCRGIGDATVNHYITALKSFGRWLHSKAQRLPSDPFGDLTAVQVLERRHARRELPADDLRRLLGTTAASVRTFRSLNGLDRSVLYATAGGTGFRAGGLASLTPECFHLGGEWPTITLPVRADKSKKGKVQPIPAELAGTLREYLRGKPAGKAVWPGTWSVDGTAADMLRADLAEAGIPAVADGPDGPEHCDFHSLRHSYLTALGRSGVDLRVQQELAGHSSPVITARYSHVRLHDLAGAVNRLPALLPAPSDPGEPLTFSLQKPPLSAGIG